nr:ribosomal protein L7Ae/L30e/S12e/Gadd45 [Tanacetum cinerariifolium]
MSLLLISLGDLNEIPSKLETFTSNISNLSSQVAKLKNIQWELQVEFLDLPHLAYSVQEKLNTLDSLLGLLKMVTNTLNRYIGKIGQLKSLKNSKPVTYSWLNRERQARLILPYGMLLTRLFKFVMSESSELSYESYVLYDRVMNPLTAHQERNTRKDRDTRRGRHSTSSSSAFDQPSSSLLIDDDDRNGEGTSCASTPSPIRFVNSLTNDVPQVFQNPPNIDPHIEPFYTRQTEIINRQVHIQDEHRGGLRSTKKGLKNLWKNMKK